MLQTTSNYQAYLGDGSSTVFPTVFPFILNSDITCFAYVVATMTTTPLVQGVDYTVTGASAPAGAGGTVTLTLPLPIGTTLQIIRTVPLTQLLNLLSFDQFPSQSMDLAFDKLTMMEQQHDRRIGILEASAGSPLTFANIGSSGAGVYAQQVGSQIQLKKLIPGTNVNIVDSGSDLTLNVVAPGISYPGTVTTFLRGDGTFTSVLGGPTAVLSATPGLTIEGSSTFGNPYYLDFFDAAGTTDNKHWAWSTSSAGTLTLAAYDDTFTNNTPVFIFARSGYALTQLIIGATGQVVQLSGANYVAGASATISGTFAFDTNSPPRIVGDMSAASNNSRFAVQNITTNGNSIFGVIPNGTSVISAVRMFGASDADNAPTVTVGVGIPTLATGKFGTGVAPNMTLAPGGNISMQLFAAAQRVQVGVQAVDDGVNTLQVNGAVTSTGGFKVSGVQVIGARQTGYAAMTGTANRGTSYDTSSVTLVQLATRVKALEDDAIAHGWIGP